MIPAYQIQITFGMSGKIESKKDYNRCSKSSFHNFFLNGEKFNLDVSMFTLPFKASVRKKCFQVLYYQKYLRT